MESERGLVGDIGKDEGLDHRRVVGINNDESIHTPWSVDP